MPKLLFYTDSGYYSGAEIYFSRLINFAVEGNYVVQVLVSKAFKDSRNPLWQEIIKHDELVTIDYFATGNKLNLFFFIKLFQYLKKIQPDIIICNMWSPFSNTALLALAKIFKIKVIGIEHFYQERNDIRGLLKPLKLMAYEFKKARIDQLVTVSETHKQILACQFGFNEDSILVLRPGVDNRINNIKDKKSNSVELIFSGTLEARKQPLFILEVLLELSDLSWHLNMLGDGTQMDEVKKYIILNKLDKKVSCLGWIEDPKTIYEKGDILVHPAKSENFSGVIVEAMSYGLPVVANNVGGNPEIIINQETGFLIPLNNKKLWIEQVTKLVKDNNLRKKLGGNGYRRFNNILTTDTMRSGFYKILSHVSK